MAAICRFHSRRRQDYAILFNFLVETRKFEDSDASVQFEIAYAHYCLSEVYAKGGMHQMAMLHRNSSIDYFDKLSLVPSQESGILVRLLEFYWLHKF